MAPRNFHGSRPSYTLHVPFDPITWPKVRDLAASRKQPMEMLIYLAVMKELETAATEPAPEPEDRPINANPWAAR